MSGLCPHDLYHIINIRPLCAQEADCYCCLLTKHAVLNMI